MKNLKVTRTFLLAVLAPSLIINSVRAEDGDFDVVDEAPTATAVPCKPSTLGRVVSSIVSLPSNAVKAVVNTVVGAVRGTSCAICSACSTVGNTAGSCLDAVANVEGSLVSPAVNFVRNHRRIVAATTVLAASAYPAMQLAKKYGIECPFKSCCKSKKQA